MHEERYALSEDTARTIDYSGAEQYCATAKASSCTTQTTSLHTAPGYDNMTGIGSPAIAAKRACIA